MCYQNPENPLSPPLSKEEIQAREAWDDLLRLLAKDVSKRLRAESKQPRAGLPDDAQEDYRPHE
jgi:hypothetical protein